MPITLNASPLAVVPIPTPSPSTAKRVEPPPTWKVFSPGVVLPIPTLSKIAILASPARLTLPNLRQSLLEL